MGNLWSKDLHTGHNSRDCYLFPQYPYSPFCLHNRTLRLLSTAMCSAKKLHFLVFLPISLANDIFGQLSKSVFTLGLSLLLFGMLTWQWSLSSNFVILSFKITCSEWQSQTNEGSWFLMTLWSCHMSPPCIVSRFHLCKGINPNNLCGWVSVTSSQTQCLESILQIYMWKAIHIIMCVVAKDL